MKTSDQINHETVCFLANTFEPWALHNSPLFHEIVKSLSAFISKCVSSGEDALPGVSHLQWLVLSLIGNSQVPGRVLRSRLESQGVRKSGPSFYQLMGRLQEAGFVVGEDVPLKTDKQTFNERAYVVTPEGHRVLKETEVFYAARRSISRFEPAPA